MEQIRQKAATPVVHVISDAGPHPYFRTLIEAGGLDPCSVVVGCVGPAGPLQTDMRQLGVATFALDARSRADYPATTVRLARFLRRERASVVQSHLVDGSLVGLAAARLASVPVSVFTAHHSHELPIHGRKLVWSDRLCAGPLCDHVIAPSQQLADVLVQFTGVDRGKIAVVPHGFDLGRLNPAEVDGSRVRAELGLGDGLVLGAIGRIYALKNYEALIRAFSAAGGAVDDAKLVIVGRGDVESLRVVAAEFGIADRVLFPGPRSDVPQLLAAFDAFLHPAVVESFGMVIIEAMAMARPVLSTPVGIAPEVIRTGITGVLCAGHTQHSLVEGLQTLMGLRSSWGRIGSTARARVAGFTAKAMAGRYVELYDEWVARDPSQPVA